MRYLHILEIKSLSVALFSDIFSLSVGCLFVFGLLWKSLWVCLGPICLLLLLFLLTWATDLRKLCCALCQRTFYLCSFLVVLRDLVFNLSLSAIFILILWMVRGSVLTSLIYMHHGQLLQVKWYLDILLNIKKITVALKTQKLNSVFFVLLIFAFFIESVRWCMEVTRPTWDLQISSCCIIPPPSSFLFDQSIRLVLSLGVFIFANLVNWWEEAFEKVYFRI